MYRIIVDGLFISYLTPSLMISDNYYYVMNGSFSLLVKIK